MAEFATEGVDAGGACIGEGRNSIDKDFRERILVALCSELDDGVKQWVTYGQRQIRITRCWRIVRNINTGLAMLG